MLGYANWFACQHLSCPCMCKQVIKGHEVQLTTPGVQCERSALWKAAPQLPTSICNMEEFSLTWIPLLHHTHTHTSPCILKGEEVWETKCKKSCSINTSIHLRSHWSQSSRFFSSLGGSVGRSHTCVNSEGAINLPCCQGAARETLTPSAMQWNVFVITKRPISFFLHTRNLRITQPREREEFVSIKPRGKNEVIIWSTSPERWRKWTRRNQRNTNGYAALCNPWV